MKLAIFIVISSHLILLWGSIPTSTKFIWLILVLLSSILIRIVSFMRFVVMSVCCIEKPYEERKNTDFRGTITYASLNAHNKVDLSRRDDLWSFYFVILDFLGEELPWRTCKLLVENDWSISVYQRLSERSKNPSIQAAWLVSMEIKDEEYLECEEDLLSSLELGVFIEAWLWFDKVRLIITYYYDIDTTSTTCLNNKTLSVLPL